MSYDNNPYYNPDKCGLEIVGYIDRSSGSYEFDYFVVWYRVKDDKFLYGSDTG